MKTSDLITVTANKINENLEKAFGKRINFSKFNNTQLEDARNKLRTQLYQMRSESKFNENLESETFYETQWMLDALNAEISEREDVEENIANEGASDTKAKMKQIVSAFKPLTKGEKVVKAFSYKPGKEFASVPVIITENPKADEMYGPFASYIYSQQSGEMLHSYYHPDIEDAVSYAKTEIKDDAEQGNLDPSAGQQRLPFEEVFSDNTAENDNKQNIGTNHMEDIDNKFQNFIVNEDEVEQASAIVTANSMVDKISRWIEELSSMENDTLLSLGDSIRSEMGQQEAKQFLSTSAPAIEDALDHLKQTRDEMSNAVRVLTGQETATDMIGDTDTDDDSDTDVDMDMDASEVDLDLDDEGDDFETSDPAAGGIEPEGREQRESYERANNFYRILAG